MNEVMIIDPIISELDLVTQSDFYIDARVEPYPQTVEEVANTVKKIMGKVLKNEYGKRKVFKISDFAYKDSYSDNKDSELWGLQGSPTRAIMIITKSPNTGNWKIVFLDLFYRKTFWVILWRKPCLRK